MSTYNIEYKGNRPDTLIFIPSYDGTTRYDTKAAKVAQELIGKNYFRDVYLYDSREGAVKIRLNPDMEQSQIRARMEEVEQAITALVDRIQETLTIMKAVKDETL